MSVFLIDSEDFSDDGKAAFGAVLSPLVESDIPLTVEISLVSEEEIQALNRTYRNIDRVTDVLSFPALSLSAGEEIKQENYPLEIEDGKLLLGSVAICKKRAREQAEEYGHSVRRELFYLAVHGILHCLGYDHETDEEKKVMREREESVMNALLLPRE